MEKILIADDDENIRSSEKSLLESQGYEVIEAEDGDEVLKKSKGVDLVLLDIRMPGPDPKTIPEKIKDVKIMYLTAVDIGDAAKKGLLEHSNVVGLIEKPFEVKEFINHVKTALRGV